MVRGSLSIRETLICETDGGSARSLLCVLSVHGLSQCMCFGFAFFNEHITSIAELTFSKNELAVALTKIVV